MIIANLCGFVCGHLLRRGRGPARAPPRAAGPSWPAGRDRRPAGLHDLPDAGSISSVCSPSPFSATLKVSFDFKDGAAFME